MIDYDRQENADGTVTLFKPDTSEVIVTFSNAKDENSIAMALNRVYEKGCLEGKEYVKDSIRSKLGL